MSHLQARIAEKRVPQFQTVSRTIPSPVLGWNARDALDTQDPRYALVMQNFFPDGTNVRLRDGTEDHATGFPGPVEYVHTFAAGQQRKIIAFSGGNAYDATIFGAVGVPLATGFVNSRFFGVNAGTLGGEVALYANGADNIQQYDGTTWSVSTIPNDGINGPSKATGLAISKKRLWAIDAGTGRAWYGLEEQVAGNLSLFDIGSVVPSGGELVAIGNLTVDSSQDLNDLTVFVMRSGAIILYAGTNPGDAANWSIKGVWHSGQPVGDRCLVPFDNDLIYISNAGFVSLLGLTTQGAVGGVPISDNISQAVSESTKIYGNLYGWNGIFHPRSRQLIFNIPQVENATTRQYVMNSLYKGWCEYTGIDAITATIANDELYFGKNEKIVKRTDVTSGGITVNSDSGVGIPWFVQTAWNYFGIPEREKVFKQYRPHIRADSEVSLGLAIGTDFRDPVAAPPVSLAPAPAAEWDVDEWDVGIWAGGLENFFDWRQAGNKGFNASISFSGVTLGTRVEILATNIIFEVGSRI